MNNLKLFRSSNIGRSADSIIYIMVHVIFVYTASPFQQEWPFERTRTFDGKFAY